MKKAINKYHISKIVLLIGDSDEKIMLSPLYSDGIIVFGPPLYILIKSFLCDNSLDLCLYSFNISFFISFLAYPNLLFSSFGDI